MTSNTPNAEAIAAIEEADRISHDPNTKRYSNVKELFAELKAEIDVVYQDYLNGDYISASEIEERWEV